MFGGGIIRSHAIALGFALVALSAGGAFAAAPRPGSRSRPIRRSRRLRTWAPPTRPLSQHKTAPSDPITAALRDKLAALPTEGSAQKSGARGPLGLLQRQSRAALGRRRRPDANGGAVIAELMKAGDWGLDPGDFALPHIADAAMANLAPAEVADAEVAISLAVLKYVRFARGGRIIDPTILLTSQFDRKPQLLDPEVVFAAIAAADAPDAYLRGVHPKQPQFEKLRQAYLANRGKPLAKKLLANMEEWRWMPDDLGAVHILANVPEFMVYLYKDDKVIHTERIVVGETGKQTTIFSRNLKTIVFKPMWRVPGVDQGARAAAQPAARRQHVPASTTSSCRPRTARRSTTAQSTGAPPTSQLRGGAAARPQERDGRRQVHVPEPAPIFMHDTVDKWMFAQSQRTLSHGCLRLRNPMKMAELVLAEDKGWDAAKVEQMMSDGPRNNEDRHREEDPDAPRLLHGVGGR